MTLQQQQAKFCLDTARLIEYIFSHEYMCTYGDAYRSPEQAALNASKGIGIKNSLHCERLALDINLFDKNGKYISGDHPFYNQLGSYWKSLDADNVWGGEWKKKDLNHFERSKI